MRFEKIKYDPKTGTVTLRFFAHGEHHVVECDDNPRPAFHTALQALRIDVPTLCELDELETTRLKVRGVTITYGDDEQGLTISATYALKENTTPLVLNTPHTTDYARSTQDRVDDLIEQARLYMSGEREQIGMFETPTTPPAANDTETTIDVSFTDPKTGKRVSSGPAPLSAVRQALDAVKGSKKARGSRATPR